ncbi:MAG: NIPSNAP family protein [Saprospiraceae bacterium]
MLFAFPHPQLIKTDTRVFELRIYHCEDNKLPDLIARFQNHTTKLFERHGMENIGYWLPTAADNNSLYYILAYPTMAARDSAWKHFGNDEEWKKVRAESEVNGKIVKSVETLFLNAEDFSPKVTSSVKSPERVFELRTYTCLPDQLPKLESRFRDFTLKLFKKHGMTNIAYWKTIEKNPTDQSKLVYILAHESEAAAKKSFDAFRLDKDWIAARDQSEANGKIVDHLESIFMKPLSFSKYK